MVKFSKQFELQLVPEWRHAFCNYRTLKKELKVIKLQQHHHDAIRWPYHHHQQHAHGGDVDGGGGGWPYISNMVKWMPATHAQDVIEVWIAPDKTITFIADRDAKGFRVQGLGFRAQGSGFRHRVLEAERDHQSVV
jgi:hypothetical protein